VSEPVACASLITTLNIVYSLQYMYDLQMIWCNDTSLEYMYLYIDTCVAIVYCEEFVVLPYDVYDTSAILNVND